MWLVISPILCSNWQVADTWFVSRATLQSDMVDVREHFQRYQLTLETRPRHGMKLFGSEVSIRAATWRG